MRKTEIYQLQKENPDLLEMAFEMENNSKATNRTVKGLAHNHSWQTILTQTRLDFDTPIKTCSRCRD